ncbi:MAG: MBL fold metallo-hydrolase [Candidatus Saccharimonadales bacterium]
MDIQFYGANCIVLSNKLRRVVIDDNLKDLGAKSVTRNGDISVFTGPHGDVGQEVRIVIDQPGEFETQNVSAFGLQARSHIDEEGQKNAVIYRIIMSEVRVAIVGHIFPKLSESDLEALGSIDVLIVPVGGNGYTLDPEGALEIIKAIEPKLVIPTHYADETLNFPVPQQSLDDALKIIPIEVKERTVKLRIKPLDLTDSTQLVVVEKS